VKNASLDTFISVFLIVHALIFQISVIKLYISPCNLNFIHVFIMHLAYCTFSRYFIGIIIMMKYLLFIYMHFVF